MVKSVCGVLLASAVAVAQSPRPAPTEPFVTAKAASLQVSLCRQDEDIGRLKFGLEVELRNGGSTPFLIYRMPNHGYPYTAIATSLENATQKRFLWQQSGTVYVSDDDLVKQISRDSFFRLAPGQADRVLVRVEALVPISPRPEQIRSGTYWVTTTVMTWPRTLIRPESLDLGGPVFVRDVRLEPAEFSLTVPPILEMCE